MESELATIHHSETDERAFRAMAARLMEPGQAVSWLNHWSLLHADFKYLARMTTIGFDGTLVQMRLAAAGHKVLRTSTDLILPYVFEELPEGTRITLIGTTKEAGAAAAARLPQFEVQTIDGYEGLRHLKADPSLITAFDPRLVIVGLGAAFQDLVASKVHEWLPDASVGVAGGWIDQYAAASHEYFPDWVHNYRLGWAWRIAHEPRRLTKRYTVEALDFFAHAPELIKRLEALGQFDELGVVVD